MEWILRRPSLRGIRAVAAEIFGVTPVQNNGSGTLRRIRSLVSATASPHPLFDPSYYTRVDGGVKTGLPFLHFLVRGGFAGRKPHPLFDPNWYLLRYPDVARAHANPLQHYVNFGWREGRSPHPLFDPQWYKQRYPDAAPRDPLLDFLLRGAEAGGNPHPRSPHPLFDGAWYLRTYPDARTSGLNPLVHYLTIGAAEGKNPNPRFDARAYLDSHPEAVQAGMEPLSHLAARIYRNRIHSMRGTALESATPVQALVMAEHAPRPLKPAPLWRNPLPVTHCPVFVAYGASNVAFIESKLLPALAAQQGSFRLHLHTLNYRNPECLLSDAALSFRGGILDGVTDWSAKRSGGHIGFGESVNWLFAQVQPENCFLIVNPDSMPMAGCIAQLVTTFAQKPAAMVEARQWPTEHPKEFDPRTGETPWATGAFLLVSSQAFRRLNGFDPIYFLYNEDVDLSWRAWLEGMPVVYEPSALCAHFTGGLSVGFHRFRREQFLSIRNFLLIAYKFFGERGEQIAQAWIRQANFPDSFCHAIERSYLDLRASVRRVDNRRVFHAERIKILGLNQYHELRKV